MLLTVTLAIVVPVAFLYAIHWLDLYGSDRPRIVLLCFGWGLVAFLMSFAANRFCIDILGYSRQFVSTRTAPFVEEVFKSLILIWLVRKAKLTYFADGAIYGFAVGIGFAVIENLRYIQLFPDNPMALVIVRDFSSALAHGTATAMTGIALGGFVLSTRRHHGVLSLIVGLTGAMGLHYAWNIFANFSRFDRFTTEWIMVSVGLTGVICVSATIIWGMHRERRHLRESLGLKVGVSREEASVVQHMGDLAELLAPIEKRFGKVKRRHVASFLHLEAQIGLKEDVAERTKDPQLRAEMEKQIAIEKKALDAERSKVGVYVMLYVRTIFPETAWSLWARLGQTLTARHKPRGDIWAAVASKLATTTSPDRGLYARIEASVAARAVAEAPTMHHVRELPEALQHYVHWVMKGIHVTAQHAAAGLGHHEAHAHEVMSHLAARGFLHKTEKDGQVAFRARVAADDAHADRPHLWHGLTHRLAKHPKGTKT